MRKLDVVHVIAWDHHMSGDDEITFHANPGLRELITHAVKTVEHEGGAEGVMRGLTAALEVAVFGLSMLLGPDEAERVLREALGDYFRKLRQ